MDVVIYNHNKLRKNLEMLKKMRSLLLAIFVCGLFNAEFLATSDQDTKKIKYTSNNPLSWGEWAAYNARWIATGFAVSTAIATGLSVYYKADHSMTKKLVIGTGVATGIACNEHRAYYQIDKWNGKYEPRGYLIENQYSGCQRAYLQVLAQDNFSFAGFIASRINLQLEED